MPPGLEASLLELARERARQEQHAQDCHQPSEERPGQERAPVDVPDDATEHRWPPEGPQQEQPTGVAGHNVHLIDAGGRGRQERNAYTGAHEDEMQQRDQPWLTRNSGLAPRYVAGAQLGKLRVHPINQPARRCTLDSAQVQRG